ncbi:M23 family metallopeptidase [Helicobacter sp. 14348-15]|uniref:M23 family metallopeptidase n=1 Tax=Helicobacter TaxID=209 RepID=UPI00202A0456|nr:MULTISPECIES: M23 family metallopeptidase [Helicobacter]MCI7766080.1 M23 family metallopeptidase [Helicobacter sp.]MCL9821437.1 M23 family metallopeptidase [Helicobacter colisuis]MCL9823051.1 M23 family metallopeptidase [Helicobacter colisuis]
MKKIIILLLCVFVGFAKELTIENGKTLILESKSPNPKSIILDKKEYLWIPHPQKPDTKILFLSIPYYTKAQSIRLENSQTLQIIKGQYKIEKISVDPSKAKPNKANQQRISKEREEASKIYQTYTKGYYWKKPFIYPMKSKITSEFGNARVFNQEVKSYHSGTDFRAAIGTPIYASNSGKVVIAKDRFLAGKSVVIDHGEGIFSMYYHCSEIKVKEGTRVKQGELIALSGNTGRVSGPHLHFGILVRGTQVDPIDFIAKINASLKGN